MNMGHLTTAQAAERAQVSRPTVSRALKYGDLPAIRDNAGKWLIEPDAVDAWASKRATVHSVHRSHSVHDAPQAADDERLERLRGELAHTRETLARVEGESAMNERRMADLIAERDRWQQMAERLSHAQTVRPVSFWSRLFNRD